MELGGFSPIPPSPLLRDETPRCTNRPSSLPFFFPLFFARWLNTQFEMTAAYDESCVSNGDIPAGMDTTIAKFKVSGLPAEADLLNPEEAPRIRVFIQTDIHGIVSASSARLIQEVPKPEEPEAKGEDAAPTEQAASEGKAEEPTDANMVCWPKKDFPSALDPLPPLFFFRAPFLFWERMLFPPLLPYVLIYTNVEIVDQLLLRSLLARDDCGWELKPPGRELILQLSLAEF